MATDFGKPVDPKKPNDGKHDVKPVVLTMASEQKRIASVLMPLWHSDKRGRRNETPPAPAWDPRELPPAENGEPCKRKGKRRGKGVPRCSCPECKAADEKAQAEKKPAPSKRKADLLKGFKTLTEAAKAIGSPKLAEKIGKISCTISVQAGEEDKLFGSVTAMDIAECLSKEGVDIDRRSILLEEPIKSLGVFVVHIRIMSEVEAKLKVWIVKA